MIKSLSAILAGLVISSVSHAAGPECQPYVKAIRDLNNTYAEATLKSKAIKAASASRKIKVLLSGLDKKDHPCFQTVAEAHLLSALAHSSSFNYAQYGVQRAAEIEPLVSYNLGIVGLARTLIEDERISFLGAKGRNELGYSWSQKNKGKYQIQGAYDCRDSKVYIDPYLAPLDLAAIFVHELDHLLRDKFVDPTWLNSQFETQGMDWRHYVLVDEALASSAAAFVQRQKLEGEYYRKYSAGIKKQFQPYRIKGDLNLYARGGAVDKLIGQCELSYETLNGFLERTLLRKESLLPGQSPFLGDVDWIYMTLDKGYFPGDSDFDFSVVDPSKLSIKLSPLAAYIEGLSKSRTPEMLNVRIESMKYALELQLKHKSIQCEEFQAALKSNALSGYAGNQIQLKGESARPGETGVHPGETGVHPGETGVHPVGPKAGETGVHPGESGVHPGEAGVHPCLDFGGGI